VYLGLVFFTLGLLVDSAASPEQVAHRAIKVCQLACAACVLCACCRLAFEPFCVLSLMDV
jgi:hypothetical protein